MQDIYTVITAAMLQALKDNVIYIQTAAGYAKKPSSPESTGEQKRIADGRSSNRYAGDDTYRNAAAEALHILS